MKTKHLNWSEEGRFPAVQKITRSEYDNFVEKCKAEPKPAPKLVELMRTK